MISIVTLPSVCSSRKAVYPCWMHKKDGILLIHIEGKFGGDYCVGTILEAAIVMYDSEFFTLTDGFDGSMDVDIPMPEIKNLSRSIMSVIPPTMGRLTLKAEFVTVDPRVPF